MIDGALYLTERLRGKLEELEEELGVEFQAAPTAATVVESDRVRIQTVEAAMNGFSSIGAPAHEDYDGEHSFIYDIYRPALGVDDEDLVKHDGVGVAVIGPMSYKSLIGLNRMCWDTVSDEFIEAVVLEPIRRVCDPDYIERQREFAREARRRVIEELATRTFTSQIATLRGSIDSLAMRLTEYQDYIANATVQLRDKQRELEVAMHLQQNSPADRFVAEFEQLEAHPRVASLEVRTAGDTIIRITTTDDLRLTHPVTGESRWLGTFQVDLNLTGLTVRIKNLSTRRGERDHPHIVDNAACLGGHHQAFLQLLQRGQFFVWWDCLVQFLETLNPEDSWGAYASLWFEVEDERPLEVEEAIAA